MQRIIQIGNVRKVTENENRKRKDPSAGRLFDPNGISPCLDTAQGGLRQPFVVIREKKENGD